MKGNSRNLCPALAVIILLITVFPLNAQSKIKLTWFGAGSVLFFPERNGVHSDAMHVLPSPGAGLALNVFGRLPINLEITLDLYLATYGYSYVLNRAVPRAWENRSAAVIGQVLGSQVSYFYRFKRVPITFRAYGGLAMDIRIIFKAWDLNSALDPIDEIRRETKAVSRYFWSGVRWLLPMIGIGADYDLNEKLRLGLDFRIWFPMYRMWTKENLPAIEGWRFGIGARLTFL